MNPKNKKCELGPSQRYSMLCVTKLSRVYSLQQVNFTTTSSGCVVVRVGCYTLVVVSEEPLYTILGVLNSTYKCKSLWLSAQLMRHLHAGTTNHQRLGVEASCCSTTADTTQKPSKHHVYRVATQHPCPITSRMLVPKYTNI